MRAATATRVLAVSCAGHMLGAHGSVAHATVNHQRLYENRFRGVDQKRREGVWSAVARMLHEALGRPACWLDPVAGRREFVNAVPAAEAAVRPAL